MLSSTLFLLIAVLLPLAGALVLLFIGKRLGAPLAGWVGTTGIIGSFICTLLAMVVWMEDKHGQDIGEMGVRPILATVYWLPVGGPVLQDRPGFLSLGVYIDSLTIAIFATVTLAAAIIHIYSIGFLRRHEHFSRFFALMGLACFAMLGLVIGGTLLHLLIFWLLLSFSTALLAGSSVDRPYTSNATLRTFIIQLIGDGGFAIGVGMIFARLGNTTLPVLWALLGDAASGNPIVLPDGGVISSTFATITGLCLFLGAIAKSAQFPLHLWISDAADAPITASALICTATTTLAGVYLVGRIFPILTPDARLFIAIIGLVTLTMAALIAMAQDDLRRMLVWTAVSQLGYTMLAMGVGSWIGGLFHLMTAAFTLALLFLAAGNIIAAAQGEYRMSRLGGLWRKMPVTAGAFAIAVLATIGAHFLSGHYSQSIIASDSAAFAFYAVHNGRAWSYWIFFILPGGVIYFTAFYLARCWIHIFTGQPRSEIVYQLARESPALWGPMLALAVPTLIAGYAMNVPELLRDSIVETRKMCDDLLAQNPSSAKGKRFTAFETAWPLLRSAPETELAEASESSAPVLTPDAHAAADAHERGRLIARYWVSWAWIVGIALAGAFYARGYGFVAPLERTGLLKWARIWLIEGMFFDELYYWTIGRLIVGLSILLNALDRYIISAAGDAIIRTIAFFAGPLRRYFVLRK